MLLSKFQVKWPFGSEEARDFQDGSHGSHFGFLIGKILAIFDLPVTLMLPTKVRVSWPFDSDEANRFFKTATMVAILDFQSEPILIYLMLATKFRISCSLVILAQKIS